MSWTVYGERLLSTDFTGSPRVYQPFTLNRETKVKALRTWFVAYGTPAFTNLSMRIYDAKSGVPTVLKHTFDKVWTPGQILETHGYGLKEIYFDFTTPAWLRRDTTYCLVPWVSGNSFSATSFLSWVRGFPDPNTTHAVTLAPSNISKVPYYMALIGADK